MSIATFTELKTVIGDWLDRDDLAARASDFIRLTEVRLNRLLDDPDMEQISTATASGASTALPDDFGSMVSISDGIGRPLMPMGSGEFSGIDRSIAGEPRYYTIEDGSITFAPANSTAAIRMVYRRTIPALTEAAPTNWLLTRAPDVYLYGALVQASAFLAEDDRIGLWKSAFDEAIAELRSDGARRKWGAGPLAARVRRI
jgi:hypothetical protein